MDYSLNVGEWNSVFAVPASVVDKYIKIAGENSLKLLLYLLRHGGKSFSEEKLRDELGFRETGELEDAAFFWIQRGIIRYENDGESRALFSEKAKSEQVVQKEDLPESAPKKPAVKEKIKPAVISSGDIAERIKSDSEIKMLFDEAERLFAHPLKSSENQMLITMTDHYGLNVGAALMLLQYCFKIGKKSTNYILSCAQNWADEGIDSVEAANEKILALEKNFTIAEQLREAMELKSKLTAKMKEFIRVWTEDWGFSEEMIMLCYEKTVNAKNDFKFEYANKILENWKDAGLYTKEAVEAADLARKKPVKTASATKNENKSFDINDIMSKINNR